MVLGSDHQRKRGRPGADTVAWRRARLAEIAQPDEVAPADVPTPLLEPGNSKTGRDGRLFGSIWVWNLRPMSTCPGRSRWCSENCYNADPRAGVYPIDRWSENWRAIESSPEGSAVYLLAALASAKPRVGVRIHSSGDFYSEQYIRWWVEIATAASKVRFWAYTRSWAVGALLPALETLRALPNVQLFASWDATMGKPPEGWRLSIISEGTLVSTKRNLDCPEQYVDGPPCADCGYCIVKRSGNVIFHSH